MILSVFPDDENDGEGYDGNYVMVQVNIMKIMMKKMGKVKMIKL